MSEFLCWSCGQPIRGSESTRKSVPEAERNAYEKAGTPIYAAARCHEGCARKIRLKFLKRRQDDEAAPVAKATRSRIEPEPPLRPAAGGWDVTTEAVPVFESRTRGGAGSSAEAAEEMQPMPGDEPMLPADPFPPRRADRAAGQLECGETMCMDGAPEVLQPTPQQLGGAVVAMKAAAVREQTGASARAAPLSAEERVAVGSHCPWGCLDLEEARTRGAAEATERKRLAKRVPELESQKERLEKQVESLKKERAELAAFKKDAEKAEKERQRALKQRKGNGHMHRECEVAPDEREPLVDLQ